MSLFEFDQEEYDRNRFEEGKAVGVLEGEAVGIEKERTEGARNNALQAAKNLLSMRVLSAEQIAQATQLSIDDVNCIAATVL